MDMLSLCNPLVWTPAEGYRSFDHLETLCGILTYDVWNAVSFKNSKSTCTITKKNVYSFTNCLH